jgi:hypothetical protein
MCHARENVWTEDDSADGVNINFSAVAGVMSSGGGFNQMEEILTATDIPCMSNRSYKKYHDRVCDWWEQTASQEMEAAAKTEAAIAIEKGNIDTDGTPLLTVIADGSWCKRSYRNNYSSLSGVVSTLSLYIHHFQNFYKGIVSCGCRCDENYSHRPILVAFAKCCRILDVRVP